MSGKKGPAPDREREVLLRELEEMPAFLEQRLAGLASDASTRRGADGSFAPVEQCWHLADLEQEGYGVRLRRLLTEEAPQLADFDGGRVAEERQYRQRSLREGLRAFAEARRANLSLLRFLPEERWTRSGTQDGVGRVTLADLPRMMREHDATHQAEIEAWLAAER